MKKEDLPSFRDGKILKETKSLIYVLYKAKELASPERNMGRHKSFMAHRKVTQKPEWFLLGLDTSTFKRHYHVIIYIGIIQRYELAHSSLEKLNKVKRLLGHFVPKTAKHIIEQDPEKKGILDKYIQDATILFLDIEGFTLLLKKYPQERINLVIEHYFSLFLDVIQKNGGDINETAGDGLMVIFLDPDPLEHAKKAIRTGLDIYKICQMDFETKNPDLFSVQVNTGIHSGDVYLGSTKLRGEEGERWTFTASGRVTIMAARLSQYAGKGQIILGEETARRSGEHFKLIPLGKVSLKNIEDSGEVYQVSLS